MINDLMEYFQRVNKPQSSYCPSTQITVNLKIKILTHAVMISSMGENLIEDLDDISPEDRHSTKLLDDAEAEDDAKGLPHLRSSEEGSKSEQNSVCYLLVVFESL